MTDPKSDSCASGLVPSGGALCRASRSSARLSWVLFALAAAVPGQDAKPAPAEEFDLPAVLRELRRPNLDPGRRDQLVADLMATGADGAGHAFRIAQSRFAKLHLDFEMDRRKHLTGFAAEAPRLLAELQGPGGMEEVDALRDKVLAHSRGAAGLDKDVIKQVLDPAMARLAELLEVSARQVLEASESLREQACALDRQALELLEWHHIHDIAGVVVARTGPGARRVEAAQLPDPSGYRRELAEMRDMLARQATPMSPREARVLEANAAASSELDPEEVRGTRELNRIRLLLGLNPLALDLKLAEAGRGHSEDMLRLKFFAHESPVPGKETLGQRAALAGSSGDAENIASGQSTGAGAIRTWWYSPGHHRNMLGSYGRVGLGRANDYWTLMFGG